MKSKIYDMLMLPVLIVIISAVKDLEATFQPATMITIGVGYTV